jgi:hypothetical protein
MKWQKIDQKILSYVYVPTKYLVKYQNVNRFHFKNWKMGFLMFYIATHDQFALVDKLSKMTQK